MIYLCDKVPENRFELIAWISVRIDFHAHFFFNFYLIVFEYREHCELFAFGSIAFREINDKKEKKIII